MNDKAVKMTREFAAIGSTYSDSLCADRPASFKRLDQFMPHQKNMATRQFVKLSRDGELSLVIGCGNQTRLEF